jgi:hypothetical protein
MKNPSHITLTAPLQLAAAADAALPAQFSGVAYSGGLAASHGVIIDLATTRFDATMPLLANHNRAEIIGVVDQIGNDGASLTVGGKLFSDIAGSGGEQIAQRAQRGAPYQMSVGLYEYNELWVSSGSSLTVNGKVVTGPVAVLQNGYVREVSIVALGADANTDAQFFSAPSDSSPTTQGSAMTIEQLTARVAELTAQLAAANGATQSAVDLAVKAERERIQGVEAQSIPGHEALVLSLKFDGKTSPGDAAVAVLAAEKQKRAGHAAALAADAPATLQLAAPPAVEQGAAAGGEKSRAELHAAAAAHMAANPGVTYVAAYKAVGGK